MKRSNPTALILVSALAALIVIFSFNGVQAAEDMTASDRASAKAAEKTSTDNPESDTDDQAPVNNIIPYLVPEDFNGAKQQIQRCAALTDNLLRIQCFDRLANDLGVTPAKEASKREEELGKFGFWRVTSKANDVGEMLTNARLGADKPYLSSKGIERNAEFIISCKTQSTDAYIDWKEFIPTGNSMGNKFELVYSLDNQPGILARWDVSFDRFATFAPHALDFVRGLHGKKTMVFQGKPSGDSAVTLVFTLDGLENVLKILYDRCYSSPAPE